VIGCCLLWLMANLLANAGLAALSLTYGFDTNLDKVALSLTNVSVPDMSHFFESTSPDVITPDLMTEEYVAHKLVYERSSNHCSHG